MPPGQPANFVADRPERAVLDFDKFFAQIGFDDGIHAEFAQSHFHPARFAGVETFQLAVEGGFHTSYIARPCRSE